METNHQESAEKGDPRGRCPRCGVTLPPDAPEALCPRCLMAANLESGTEFTGAGEAGRIADGLPAESPETNIGSLREHFPQLEIFECLGRGGMGVVYRARQKSLNREVALKILAPERARDPDFAERFQKEAHALAALNHPNIVTVYDFGETGGRYFLLMEYVDGVNLRQAMSAGRFTPEEALSIVPPVCEALEYAHDHGVVHRDIKPENLLLDREGRVKIADFGIARMMVGGLASTDAEPGGADIAKDAPASLLAGTPRYMAPEQREPDRMGNPDHRVDIYGLGVVLYELLTGETPQGNLTPPSKKVDVDVKIDEIVLRALESEPELRFATAADFRTGVESVVRESKGSEGARTASEEFDGRESRPFDTSELRSGAQRFAWVFLPRSWFASLRRESLEWKYEGECGHGMGGGSVWEMGGIRWKASGNPKRWLFCSECGEFRWFTLRRREGSVPESDTQVEGPPSKIGAWIWTLVATLMAGLAMVVGAGVLSEWWNHSTLGWAIAGAGIVVVAGLLVRRTHHLLESYRPEDGRLRIAPPGLGWVGIVLAGLSGILGVVLLSDQGEDPRGERVLGVLAIACALLGMGAGLLSRKTPIAIVAIAIGFTNLTLAGIFALVFSLRSPSPEPSTVDFPNAAHISRSEGSIMVHSRNGKLDYLIYSEFPFNSSSAGSHNQHSLTWIENVSLEVKEIGRTFGYLRDSVNPDFVRINGAEYDLREGRVFQLEESGSVHQLALFPEPEQIEEPSQVAALIESWNRDQEPAVKIVTEDYTLEAESIEIGTREEASEKPGAAKLPQLESEPSSSPSVIR